MKNCGTRFHYVAADESLFKTLLRLARPRISGKRMFGVSSSGNYMRDLMEERVLLLIRAWGKAFSDRTNSRMRAVLPLQMAFSLVFPWSFY